MTSIDDQINERKTCAQRIEDYLNDREEYLSELFDAIDNNEPFDGYDDPTESLYDYGLGISTRIVVKIEISAGGPSDWLEVIVDNDSGYPEIDKITYHFADWFDHAEMKVSVDSPFYRYVENILDSII